MMGDGTPTGKGIIPRLVESIFTSIAHASDNIEFTVKLAYIEIYNEKLKDLLTASPAATQQPQLKIREGPHGVYVENVTEHYLSSYQQTLQLLALGAERRAVSSTMMNSESSRSHSVCIVTIGQTDKLTGSKKGSKLTLTDLAGSEKVQKTGAEGERLNEAKSINKSLSALGNVINALSSKQKHVPYRDSKLTRLLSDSLGGNSKTSLIITASPMSYNADETLSTLRFGVRAKLIKNKPAVNAEKSASEYKRMLELCNEQLRCAEEIIGGLEADVTVLTRYIEGKGLMVPVLSGMSGAGIQVQMRAADALEARKAGNEAKQSLDGTADEDDDEADAESEDISSSASTAKVSIEEHKEAPVVPVANKPSSKRGSQSGLSDLSSLPARLALLTSELSQLSSERNRLLDQLSDREAEMSEQEEIWKTEQELLALEVKRVMSELDAQRRDERKWRAEWEGMDKEVELMRKKHELMEKEHAVTVGELKEERRQLQEKLSEVLMELSRRQEEQQAQLAAKAVVESKKVESVVKDDLALTIQVQVASSNGRPSSASPDGRPATTPTAAANVPNSPSKSAVHPLMMKKTHQRLQSRTLKKGDLAHPFTASASSSASSAAHSPAHSRTESMSSLSSTLSLLHDDTKKIDTLTAALTKKCSQYLQLKEAYCNSNDHIAMLEMALADANAKIKEAGDKQRDRIEVLERKLAEAEGLCGKLLVMEKNKRASGQLRLNGLDVSGGSGGGGGGGGTIVVPVAVQGKGNAGGGNANGGRGMGSKRLMSMGGMDAFF